MKPISIKIKALHQNAVLPTYATDGGFGSTGV
jgi:hypothetical protein